MLFYEKSIGLGGLATAGLINLFVPMCNGRGKQIIFGLCEKWTRLSAKYVYDTIPEEWKNEASTGEEPNKYRTSTEQVPNKLNHIIFTENENIKRLIIAIGNQQISVKQIMEELKLKHRPTFINNYLTPAITDGFVKPLYPNSPRHPRQKYLLTVKGLALYNTL